MTRFVNSLQAWGTPDFQSVLKQEVAQLGNDKLPLQQGLSAGNHVADAPVTVLVHSFTELENSIRVQAGIFYTGLLLGCSCADDPSPPGESNEYCEIQLDIDKTSAEATIKLVAE